MSVWGHASARSRTPLSRMHFIRQTLFGTLCSILFSVSVRLTKISGRSRTKNAHGSQHRRTGCRTTCARRRPRPAHGSVMGRTSLGPGRRKTKTKTILAVHQVPQDASWHVRATEFLDLPGCRLGGYMWGCGDTSHGVRRHLLIRDVPRSCGLRGGGQLGLDQVRPIQCKIQ